ncbi:MAG: hypothetical protein WCK03_00215 [Candidatus Taylorbacteria bacterium]
MKDKTTYPYELLQRIVDLFPAPRSVDLSKTYIFACQHILEPQQKMFAQLIDAGVPRENIFVLGKAYSTNNEVLKELQGDGINAEQPIFNFLVSFDEQHKADCSALFNTFKEVVSGKARVIILDDGAGLLSVFNENFDKISSDIEIVGVEQTSSGFRRLESEVLKFPIINVARSAVKLSKESGFIAESCYQRINEYLETNKIYQNRFLVVGLGPIGQAIVDLLQKENKEVFGFDTILGHQNLIGKIQELKPNVIIGATGSTVISKDDVLTLNSLGYKIYLASVSSSDREFAIVDYQKGDDLQIHSDVEFENITFLNKGFPINFKGNRNEGAVEGIERTICLLLGAVLYWISKDSLVNIPKKFIEVPEKVTNIL